MLVTIHGTFAPKATWVNEDSAAVTTVSRRLGKPTHVLVFRWSGRNSHRARLMAAKELSHALRELARAYPELPIYIIAHSHGGNVALYALRDNELQRSVRAVVFLGTPFIDCKPRDLQAVTYILKPLPFVVFFATGLLLIGLTVGLTTEAAAPPPKWVIWQVLVAFALSLLTWALVHAVIGRLPQWQERIVNELRVPAFIPVRMFVASTSTDEAYTHLRAHTLLSRLSTRTLNAFHGRRIAIVSLGLTAGIIYNWSSVVSAENGALHVALTLVVYCAIASMIAEFYAYQITVVLAFVFWALHLLTVPLGFGRYLPGADLLVEVAVNRSYARHGIENRSYSFDCTGVGRILPANWWHGLFYRDERCLSEIADWLAKLHRQ